METHLVMAFLSLGPWEIFLACMVALLLFGPRLPKVMRSLGKGIVEFKKGIRDTEEEIERELDRPPQSDSGKQIEHNPDEATSTD